MTDPAVTKVMDWFNGEDNKDHYPTVKELLEMVAREKDEQFKQILFGLQRKMHDATCYNYVTDALNELKVRK